MKTSLKISGLSLGLATFATAALAHTGVDHGTGFLAGMSHPIGGVDHMMAMVAVGLIAVAMGGRALIGLPVMFVGMMLVGGVLGAFGYVPQGVEQVIAASLIVFGLALIFSSKAPLMAVYAAVGAFAVFHGIAHGAEMSGSSLAAYGAGFALSTALLHLTGIGLGILAGRFVTTSSLAFRLIGVPGIVAGLYMLAA